MAFSPHDAARHTIDRASALLAEVGNVRPQVADDLRRLSIAMAVAALDTYMHRLIVDRAYTHKELPGKLARLSFTFSFALDQADANAAAARANPRNSRPRVALKRAVRDRLSRDSFQSYEDVSAALGMAGLSKNWPAIGQRLTPSLQPDQIRERLNGIVARRNRIVHEGDYERLERPQGPRLTAIAQAEASDDVAFLSALIDAIHGVA